MCCTSSTSASCGCVQGANAVSTNERNTARAAGKYFRKAKTEFTPSRGYRTNLEGDNVVSGEFGRGRFVAVPHKGHIVARDGARVDLFRDRATERNVATCGAALAATSVSRYCRAEGCPPLKGRA